MIRGRTAIAAAALAGALALPCAAHGQARGDISADRLCSVSGSVTTPPTFAAETELNRVADAVEAQLDGLRARGDASSADVRALDIALAATAAPPSHALARYCAAAGELMRLSAGGSQRQAQTYLLAAFRLAKDSDNPLASRIAYRLALVGAGEAGAEGARGAAASAGETQNEDDAADGETSCDELTPGRVGGLSQSDLSNIALSCAADRALAAGDRRLAALAGLRLARIEGATGDQPGQDRETFHGFARERAQQAIGIALALGDMPDRAPLIGRLAATAVDYGDRDSAQLRAAILALAARDGDPEALSMAAALTARIALAQGDTAAAQAAAGRAILAESQRAVPARLPSLYLLLAEAEPARRAEHVRTAYVTLENLRPLLPRVDPLSEESSFSLYMRAVFTAAADVELAGGAMGDETTRIRRAQQVVEAFRQAELQSAFGSECLPVRAAADLDRLSPGETILYPLLFADRVELITVSADGYRRLPPDRSVDRAEVAGLVEQVALSLSRGDGGDWRPAARRLYDILIAPVADRLSQSGMLAIVPDGPLRALPFAALIAPDGRFLVQQTRLGIVPALAFSEAGTARRTAQLDVVAASLQRAVDLPVGAFTALPGTEAEARIAVSYSRGGAFVPDFTRGQLELALSGRVDVLHLATHAAFNGRSDRAFIVANGEVIRLTELRDMIGRSGLRGDAIDLIILSACETAVGDDEASMGLAGAAVQAGARSVIGSLWQVNDAGTAELMRQFYARYATGRSRSEALREAQLAMIERGGGDADPNVWAAFALLGAWR